jgi:tetratricopeptide (TPR) repeat protein
VDKEIPDVRPETADPGPSINRSDLGRLGPPLLVWLRDFLPFTDGRFWEPDSRGKCLRSLRLSERQTVRAKDTLSRGAGFWDRIGHNVLVPLSAGETQLGILTLSGVSRAIGPEEAARWLPLLRSQIEDRLRLLRIETALSPAGQLPRYLLLCLDDLYTGGKDLCAAVVHFVWNRPGRTVSRASRPYPGRVLVDFCSGLWPGGNPEWMGGSTEDAWILLSGTDEALFASGMKQIIARGKKEGLSISGAHGCAFRPDCEPKWVTENILETLDAAAELGAAVLSHHDLTDLRHRTGVERLGESLRRMRGTLRGRKGLMTAFGRPISIALEGTLSEESTVIRAGRDSAFLLRQIDTKSAQPEPTEWATRVQALAAASEEEAPTLGVASSPQPRMNRACLAVSALMAYIHAALLGDGSATVFDALTCNVSGDEFSSWGDLSGACRHYRAGLKLAPRDANLLNSLGVCLAELGRAREAAYSFSEATVSSPDDFMAYYNLGGVFREIGELEKAREALTKAFQLKPSDLRVAIRLTETLLETGGAAEAVRILLPFTRDSIKNLPGVFFRILGQAYWSRDAWQNARDAWHEALKRNPADPESLALLALGYLEKAGDEKTAARLCRQARALAGGDKGRARDILISLDRVLNP